MRLPAIDWSWKRLSVKIILLIIMFNCHYDNNRDNNKFIFVERKLTKIIVSYSNSFFLNVTHNSWKYLPTIGHVFHCITHFSCQILSFIHTFVLHMNGVKVDADYIPKLGFFTWDFWSQKGCTNTGNIRPFMVMYNV